ESQQPLRRLRDPTFQAVLGTRALRGSRLDKDCILGESRRLMVHLRMRLLSFSFRLEALHLPQDPASVSPQIWWRLPRSPLMRRLGQEMGLWTSWLDR